MTYAFLLASQFIHTTPQPMNSKATQPRADKNILIVDDEWLVAEALKESLTLHGYTICGITGVAEQAITMTASQKPDLVLMDIRLDGGRDGIDAAREIRKQSGTPIIFLSAFSDADTLQRARSIRPEGYLIKPFRDEELHATVEMALHRNQASQPGPAQESIWKAVFDASMDGVVVMNGLAQICHFNPAALRMFKHEAATAAGKLFPSLFAPDLSATHAYIRVFQSLATPAGALNGHRVDMTGVRSDGSVFPAELTMTKLNDDAYAAFVRDVTERKRLDDELNKFVSNLLRGTQMRRPFPELVPICAACSKGRNEKGEWVRIETYLMDHLDITFTHGYCKECANRLLDTLPHRSGKRV